MPSLLQLLLTEVLVYKYVAIFLITFLGALAAPLPANSIITASSFFALQGYLDLPEVFVAGFFGNVLGDMTGYLLARTFGGTVFTKLRLQRTLNAPTVVGIEERVQRHPFSTILVSRFISALTPIANVFAGIARVPLSIFLGAEIIGALMEVGLACLMGVTFGDNWQYIQDLLGNIGGMIALVVILVVITVWRRRARVRSPGRNR